MITSASFAFLHFFAVFGIVGTLFFEWLTLDRALTLVAARRIQICDRWYGVCAAMLLVVGALRVAYFEKGWAFYAVNPFFFVKIGLFLLIGLISIYPTIRFIKWGPQLKQGAAPVLAEREYTLIAIALRTELVLLVGVALCASLMARGIGI